jgi:hypothetical protein
MESNLKNFNTILAVGAVAAVCGAAEAAVLYSSSMKAPPMNSGNLVGQDSWVAISGAGSTPIQVGASGTTLVQGPDSREDAGCIFTAISAGQTYYFGFDVTVTGGDSNVYFAHLGAGGNSGFSARVFITASAGSDFTFGLSGNSNTFVTWGTGLSFGTSYRVVGSYTQGSNVTRLWVNPASESGTSITSTSSSSIAISSFHLRQASGNSSQLISNLAVATTFDEVSLVPAPGAMALLGVAGLLGARRRR